MEFAHVGKHCTLRECQQQDFMPFECVFCKEIFCATHRRSDDHRCKAGSLETNSRYCIICPLCDARVSYNASGTAHTKADQALEADLIWQKH